MIIYPQSVMDNPSPLRLTTNKTMQDPEVLVLVNSLKTTLSKGVTGPLLSLRLALEDQQQLKSNLHEVDSSQPQPQQPQMEPENSSPAESPVASLVRVEKRPRGRPRKTPAKKNDEFKLNHEISESDSLEAKASMKTGPEATESRLQTAESDHVMRKSPIERTVSSPIDVKLASPPPDPASETNTEIIDIDGYSSDGNSDGAASLLEAKRRKRSKVAPTSKELGSEQDCDGSEKKLPSLQQGSDEETQVPTDSSDEEIVVEIDQDVSLKDKLPVKKDKVRERVKNYLRDKLDYVNDQTLRILRQTFLIDLDPNLDIDGVYTFDELIRKLRPMMGQKSDRHLVTHHDLYRVFLRLQPYLLAKIQDGGETAPVTPIERPKPGTAPFSQIIRALSAELGNTNTIAALRLAVREGMRVHNLVGLFGTGVLALNYILKPHKLAESGDEQWARALQEMEEREGEWMEEMRKKYGSGLSEMSAKGNGIA
ncbi:hypothetical protein BC938DRAFT_473624 [Jimgerdemannia flammicorona]|uniref:Uncharacterized protein n=1 Tax=Jimgerdemannia flammicorona TaxID=994334 RepID=A0A433Q3P9_9FUNG|nr:hypothetical protein BC938DRAFT_473624 [Jimgerdemannia flammicorona]